MATVDPTDELFRAAREWLARYYPGRLLRRLRLDLDPEEQAVLPVPVGDGRRALPDRHDAVESDDPGDRRTRSPRCADDIIQTLHEADHRLTRTRLLSEMTRAGREWSERHVAGELARMVEDGTLTNDRDARGHGYGLPEWESTSDE